MATTDSDTPIGPPWYDRSAALTLILAASQIEAPPPEPETGRPFDILLQWIAHYVAEGRLPTDPPTGHDPLTPAATAATRTGYALARNALHTPRIRLHPNRGHDHAFGMALDLLYTEVPIFCAPEVLAHIHANLSANVREWLHAHSTDDQVERATLIACALAGISCAAWEHDRWHPSFLKRQATKSARRRKLPPPTTPAAKGER